MEAVDRVNPKKTKIPFKIFSEGDSRWAHLESNQAPTAPKDRGSQLLSFWFC